MVSVSDFFRSESLARSRFVTTIAYLGPLLVFAGLAMALLYAPTERVMGDVQRIFYFHVGSAMACYLMVGVLFAASVLYLVQRRPEWDICADASASVALLFAGIVLITGMIWGHSAWNTWWRWEPRLVSFLILWFILFGVVVFRRLLDHTPQRASLAAVFGIVAALNVPVVVFSVKLLDRAEQLHPQVVGNQGLRAASFVQTLVFCIIAICVFAFSLFFAKVGNIVAARELNDLHLQLTEPTGTRSRKTANSES